MGGVIKAVAPIAGTLLGGPVGGMIGSGVSSLIHTGQLSQPGQPQGGGNWLSKVGQAVGNTFAPGGNVDLGKVVGTAGEVMNMIGAGKQRKSAQDYANANIQQRNALMSKILSPQDYNLNQQSSATPGIGAGGPGGY